MNLPIEMFGHFAPMLVIRELARRRELAIVEDASLALGAEVDGCRIGTFADFIWSKSFDACYKNNIVTPRICLWMNQSWRSPAVFSVSRCDRTDRKSIHLWSQPLAQVPYSLRVKELDQDFRPSTFYAHNCQS